MKNKKETTIVRLYLLDEDEEWLKGNDREFEDYEVAEELFSKLELVANNYEHSFFE